MPLTDRRPPFLLASIGMALLTAMDAMVKALSGPYPTFQIVFMRFAFTALFVGVTALWLRQTWPAPSRWKAHLGRALLMVVTTSSFFYALGALPLAEVFALSFTSPIFTALFAAIFLKEPVRPSVMLAIGAGFAGMLVIVFGGGDIKALQGGNLLALACALLAPVTYALSVVLLRAQTASEAVTIIVTVQAALVALVLSPAVALQFVAPSPRDWLAFAVLGLLGSIGYLAFAQGLKGMSAARFSMVEYTGLIWAALIGYLFFAEVPRVSVGLGALLIIAGCVIVIRERTVKPPKPASPE